MQLTYKQGVFRLLVLCDELPCIKWNYAWLLCQVTYVPTSIELKKYWIHRPNWWQGTLTLEQVKRKKKKKNQTQGSNPRPSSASQQHYHETILRCFSFCKMYCLKTNWEEKVAKRVSANKTNNQQPATHQPVIQQQHLINENDLLAPYDVQPDDLMIHTTPASAMIFVAAPALCWWLVLLLLPRHCAIAITRKRPTWTFTVQQYDKCVAGFAK